jgi:hypothetical protein
VHLRLASIWPTSVPHRWGALGPRSALTHFPPRHYLLPLRRKGAPLQPTHWRCLRMSRHPVPLTAQDLHALLQAVLHGLIGARQPHHEGPHRCRQETFTPGTLAGVQCRPSNRAGVHLNNQQPGADNAQQRTPDGTGIMVRAETCMAQEGPDSQLGRRASVVGFVRFVGFRGRVVTAVERG